MISPGEAALVVLTMDVVIKSDVPRVGVERLREMQNLEKRVKTKARELISGELKAPKIPRIHSYRFLLDRLSRPLPPAEIQELTNKFPPEASEYSGPFVLQVQQVLDHLKQIFPTSEYVTFTGPRTLTPSDDVVFKFFNQYMVINDPLLVFDLIADGALLQSQAQAVQEFYPTLSGNKDNSGAITDALYAEIHRASALGPRRQPYQLPRKVAQGVATWLGNRTAEFNPNPQPRIVPQIKRPTTAPLKNIPQTREVEP